jgi:DinB family
LPFRKYSRFTSLIFFPQLGDALFDEPRHGNSLGIIDGFLEGYLQAAVITTSRVLAATGDKVRFPESSTATMTKDDIRLLYEYDRWANTRVLHAVSVLNAEQFTCDLGGSFRSVRDTLVHIIGGEWRWLYVLELEGALS